jgi:hypothetical protein
MAARPSTDESRLYRDSRELTTHLTAQLNQERGTDLDASDVWGVLLQALGRCRLTLEPDRGRRVARRVIATRTDL